MFDLFKRQKQYKGTFSTPEGEAVLKDLLKFCMYDSPTYVIGDPHQSAYNEGMRRVALRILSIMDMDKETVRKLQGHNSVHLDN